VARILLVAGLHHRKYAQQLREALNTQGIQVAIVTAKTDTAIVRQQVTATDAIVWLADPQTTGHKAYSRLLKFIQSRGSEVIPVAVKPYQSDLLPPASIKLSRHIDVTAQQIIAHLPHPQTARSTWRLLAGMGGLLVVLLLIVVGFGLLSNPPSDPLPTLVALDIADSTADTNAEATATVSSNLTETPTPTDDSASIETTEEAESTEAVIQAEITEEAETTDEPQLSELTPTVTPTQGTLLVDFSVNIPRGDAPLQVVVTNLSAGPIQGYLWDFESDGVVDSTDFEPPTITYNTPGVYTLTLGVVDTNNTILQSQKVIEVYSANTAQSNVGRGNAFAQFLASPASGQVPLSVQFTNRTLGSGLTYRWDFNSDGRIDHVGVSPPAFTYSQVGTYTARLDVESDEGRRDTATATINVYSSSPDDNLEQIYAEDSKADFSVSPSSGQRPLRVAITNLSAGTNNSYEWDFDSDGQIDSASDAPLPQRYGTTGTYTITLTVKGFDRFGGAKTSVAQTQVIVADRAVEPTEEPFVDDEDQDSFELFADFIAEPFEGTAPLTVQYYNYSSGENATYQWDFDGDGTIDSTAFEPSFTFAVGGVYETILYVTDITGVDEIRSLIEVNTPQTQPTQSPQPTATPQSTPTPSHTPTLTSTTIIISNDTTTPSVTPTFTLTPTPSPTSSHTPTLTATVTFTPTITPSLTPTVTFTPTFTSTFTPTATPSNTSTATPTATLEDEE